MVTSLTSDTTGAGSQASLAVGAVNTGLAGQLMVALAPAALIVGGVVSTVNVPPAVAKSLALVAAFTVNDVTVFPGVALVVLMVRVEVLELWLGVNDTGFVENDAEAPVGSAVVTLRVAVKAPLDPLPEPRFTVIVYVAELAGHRSAGDCAPMVTDPTFGESVNRHSA